ncbi:helix-turn-helix domain-containing protein [Parabacteroides distasonis]|uniref:helix-turn-helix domain-containing protein n=1 Tax=Parabacteroides distasonis TaxID=823 RepID=UPI0020C73BCD|nr:helix-turn-helix domain-containing protein [Parabacteroides distasonis]WRY45237.1 helix-turn-helix domain-containing protein [Parabacteroides distasonis]
MEKLSKKLNELGQDLKSLINTDLVLDENEKLLDNQDLAFLLKVSFRTIQRYRTKGVLPYFSIGHKTYYRASDIRAFVREHADSQSYKKFEKDNQFENQP